MKNCILLLSLLLCLSLGAQSPVVSSKISFSIDRDSRVLLLPVFVSYEDIYTDASLDPALHKGFETSEVFDSLAQHNLTQAGIQTVAVDPTNSLQVRLMAASRDLSRPVIPAALRPVVTDIARATGCRYLLACVVRVKVGPSGYWEPNSGAIGSSSSYARIHAALIDSRSGDGKPSWTQDVEIRKLPRPRSNRFAEAVQLLFQNLK